MQIKILAEGASMKPGPALSQKLGPAGINIGQVISKVNDATKNFKGMKVPVELDVNPTTKDFEVRVFSPPVSELLKKELKIEKGSGEQAQVKVANASIEDIIKVAITKFPNMLCNNLKTAVKTVAGSCVSLGILIENKTASEIEQDIEDGKFDKEINSEKTETETEKRKELDEFFSKVKGEQDKVIKQKEAAKAAEAEKDEKKAEKAKK
ncbi:MAG: 50S ribosomal protein L11 [Candidatus Pacearchaeota archaeon]|jgi:large subunit ribosomal protein L11